MTAGGTELPSGVTICVFRATPAAAEPYTRVDTRIELNRKGRGKMDEKVKEEVVERKSGLADGGRRDKYAYRRHNPHEK